MQILEIEKPIKGETTTLPEETKQCLKTILLEDTKTSKGTINPVSGQTYHSKH